MRRRSIRGRLNLNTKLPKICCNSFVKFSSPVKVEAEYELFEDDSLELRGKILYTLEGQCSRCLKETSERVEGELDAYFQPFKDGEDYAYSGGVIDLTNAVNDAIMSSMAAYALLRRKLSGHSVHKLNGGKIKEY